VGEGLVYFPAFLVGLLCVAVATGYWYLIRQTPKDKMVPWGFLGGGQMTRTAAYVTVFALLFIAALAFAMGITI
jgi:hypothetical protein